MARRIEVEITGDSKGLKAAFQESAKGADRFNQKLRGTTAELAKLGRTGGPRFWGQVTKGLLGGGAAVFGFSRAMEGAAEASRMFAGESTDLSQGLTNISNALSSLVTLDVAGFLRSTQQNAEENASAFTELAAKTKTAADIQRALANAARFASAGMEEEAEKFREIARAAQDQMDALDAATSTQRQWNTVVVAGTKYAVDFKGAVDDLTRAGRGEAVAPGRSLPAATAATALGPLSALERIRLRLAGTEGMAKIPLLLQEQKLKQQDLNNQIAAGNITLDERIARLLEIQGITGEIASIEEAERQKRQAAWRDEAAKWRRIREARVAAEQARQLRVVEGPIPTPANLRRQLEQLQARIAGGEPVSRKTRDRLAAIGRLLGGGGKIYEDTREGIRDFFQMVRSEFAKGGELLEPVATRALNTRAITAGLGLTGPQGRLLRGRLSTYNIAGRAVAKTDVYLDGQKVGHSVKRFAQNDRIHSPTQKRGPNAGR